MDLNSITSTSWKPNAGDVVEGVFLGTKTRYNDYGDYPIYLIDTGDDSVVAVHAFHSVLRKGFDEVAPEAGQYLTVCYKGTQDNAAKTRTYHNYSVRVTEKSAGVQLTLVTDEPPF